MEPTDSESPAFRQHFLRDSAWEGLSLAHCGHCVRRILGWAERERVRANARRELRDWPPGAPSPAAFFHNAGDTYRKATLTRPKPCRTAIQIGDNTRGMVESDIATFATLVRTKLCYRGRCGVRGGMVKFNSPGGMVIVGVRIGDIIREYQIATYVSKGTFAHQRARSRGLAVSSVLLATMAR
jgi:hypothetical protein